MSLVQNHNLEQLAASEKNLTEEYESEKNQSTEVHLAPEPPEVGVQAGYSLQIIHTWD